MTIWEQKVEWKSENGQVKLIKFQMTEVELLVVKMQKFEGKSPKGERAKSSG